MDETRWVPEMRTWVGRYVYVTGGAKCSVLSDKHRGDERGRGCGREIIKQRTRQYGGTDGPPGAPMYLCICLVASFQGNLGMRQAEPCFPHFATNFGLMRTILQIGLVNRSQFHD